MFILIFVNLKQFNVTYSYGFIYVLILTFKILRKLWKRKHIWWTIYPLNKCCNLNFGFATKARACEGAGQEWSHGVTFHALESVGKCEGMNFHIPMFIWELECWWIPKSSRINFKGQNPLDWKIPYIVEKLLEHEFLKWACMTHLGI